MPATEKERKTLGVRLRLAREEMDFSQREMGRQIGFTLDQVSFWERTGRIDAIALFAVSDLTGRPLDWFRIPIYEDA